MSLDLDPCWKLVGPKTKPTPYNSPIVFNARSAITQTPNQVYPPNMVSGVIFASGIMPIQNYLPQESISRETYMKIGEDVLQNVEAHETSRLGELAQSIRTRLKLLKDSASLTSSQWQHFSELTSAINDLIGDEDDTGSNSRDNPSS